MTMSPANVAPLHFLVRVVRKEASYLDVTARRLFSVPFTPDRAAERDQDVEVAERVDAFVSRFGRLQDTLGDKLLPALLTARGERTSAAIIVLLGFLLIMNLTAVIIRRRMERKW